jgi:hypothetical protein
LEHAEEELLLLAGHDDELELLDIDELCGGPLREDPVPQMQSP